jgi:ABC-type uncharacterized transport system permease subunit
VELQGLARLRRLRPIFLPFALITGAVLLVIHRHYGRSPAETLRAVTSSLLSAYGSLLLISGIAAWLLVWEQERRRAAQEHSNLQNKMLMQEIEAHEKTGAQLQKEKERAESANVAKTRYVVGISHECARR